MRIVYNGHIMEFKDYPRPNITTDIVLFRIDNKETENTIIMITHSTEEADNMCDKTIKL